MHKVVLVDKNDKVLGLKEKFATHKVPVSCHRAISIVIFNKDKSEMLITKRAKTKPTWPEIWTNSVCSHPYPKESYQKAAERRIYEELGFKTPLKEVFNFTYKAEMDNGLWGNTSLTTPLLENIKVKLIQTLRRFPVTSGSKLPI